MQNYRMPRDRVKGYTSRPLLVDVVVQRQPPARVATKTPSIAQNNPFVLVGNSTTVQPLNESQPKDIGRSLHNMRFLTTKKRVVYAATTLLVLVAVFGNITNLASKIPLEPPAEAGGTTVVAGEATNATDPVVAQQVDETVPPQNKIRDYAVTSDLPRFLNIKSIGVYARVVRIGVNNSNEMLTPNNINDTGWYEGSSKPGEPGAVFINGHVSGPTKKGVFYNLKKLSIGDVIKLETGNAEVIEYKVVHTEQVDADQVNMNKVLRSFDVDKQGLNLMTCGGEFDSGSESYKKRIIIYAIRV